MIIRGGRTFCYLPTFWTIKVIKFTVNQCRDVLERFLYISRPIVVLTRHLVGEWSKLSAWRRTEVGMSEVWTRACCPFTPGMKWHFRCVFGGQCNVVHSAIIATPMSASLSVRDKSEHCENGER